MTTIITNKIDLNNLKKRAIIALISSIVLLSAGYLLFEQTLSNNSAKDLSNYTLLDKQLANNVSVTKVQDLDKLNSVTFTDEYGKIKTIYVYDSNFHANKDNNKLIVKEWLSKNNSDKQYTVEAVK